MIGPLRRMMERFRGGGEYAVTVPPMDGALRPNRGIEEARLVLAIPEPDNLVAGAGRVLFSSGETVFELDAATGEVSEVARFDSAVTALAIADGGGVAVGLDSGKIVFKGGRLDGKMIDRSGSARLVCPVALLFASSGDLIVAEGSATRAPSQWKSDVMERGASGSVWRLNPATGKSDRLAGGLSYPYGLVLGADGAIIVSESWNHRLISIAADGGAPKPVLEDLPGYPARIAATADGKGYWLSVFAPRSQLIEFVQREREFRERMMADIDPSYWVAPTLTASNTFLEPLQGGAQKHLGILKPWAPTRSYGLVVYLDRHFRPLASHHSRADGTRHGVTSCIETGGRILATSKGGNAILALAPPDLSVTIAARREAGN